VAGNGGVGDATLAPGGPSRACPGMRAAAEAPDGR